MTQPPQWGAPPQQRPPQPPAGYLPPPQVQAPPTYGWLPPKPPVLFVVTLLHWMFALATFGLAVFGILSVAMSAERAYVGISFAIIAALFGSLNVPAALALHHPQSPNAGLSRWASFGTACTFGGALFRAAGMDSTGPIEWSVVGAMMAVCLLNLFLTTRPRVKHWIAAVRRQSLDQGLRPRR